uniref:2S seed storage protein-like n=1 Tax=Erigeron canadensis TaxID=72917 RepID=UPI001CB91D7E|nr:2S seed storage protein-like [Erigeron canadensis]
MAKLTLLALAFTALVAFAAAHTTIVTTTVEDENPIPVPSFIPPIPGVTGPMCRLKLQFQQLDKCQMYLQQGQIPYDELNRGQYQQGGQLQEQRLQQQCCQQLQNVESRCQCEAVKQVLENVQQFQGQQQGQFGLQHQLAEQKAQRLPQQCRLQVREQECQIRGSSGGFSNPQQQCSRVQGQSFNQCQRFIQQAQQESGSLMRISRQSQQLQQQLQQCCNELENVQRDCQCEAFEEVYRQAVQQQQGGRQQQQRPWQQQGGQQRPWQQQGGQHQQQPWQQQGGQQQIGQAMQAIRDQCNIEVQQCRVPSAMF